ncbi:hypothetical protein PN398_00500 [Romboutsia sp. 1001216sp1]|uniref:hypothetical protein n=1 Tax=Romboutsia sp. 1001216sp1 TaxID=2986997 RepID=UPI00233009E1|nr:hypothetical protein [Romboutsia sp. 1001216sp1]MDB8789193.1 hypothetical protein [Romboutsia sp. 1001216sp1]
MKNYFQRLKERLKWELKNLYKIFIPIVVIIVLLAIVSGQSEDETANREEDTFKNNNIEMSDEEIAINTVKNAVDERNKSITLGYALDNGIKFPKWTYDSNKNIVTFSGETSIDGRVSNISIDFIPNLDNGNVEYYAMYANYYQLNQKEFSDFLWNLFQSFENPLKDAEKEQERIDNISYWVTGTLPKTSFNEEEERLKAIKNSKLNSYENKTLDELLSSKYKIVDWTVRDYNSSDISFVSDITIEDKEENLYKFTFSCSPFDSSQVDNSEVGGVIMLIDTLYCKNNASDSIKLEKEQAEQFFEDLIK